MTDRILKELEDRGERRHETCRFGRLTKAWRVTANGEAPTTVPLCTWTLPTPIPPHVTRAVGGLVDYVRDCAVCDCHQPVEPSEVFTVAA